MGLIALIDSYHAAIKQGFHLGLWLSLIPLLILSGEVCVKVSLLHSLLQLSVHSIKLF